MVIWQFARFFSVLVDLEREAGETAVDGRVELRDVLVGRVLVERRRVSIAQLRQRLGPELDKLLEAAEDLFGLLALCTVVLLLRLVHAGQEGRVLLLEEIELAVDQLREAPGHSRLRLTAW